LRAYYDDHRDEFSRPEQVHARHILLAVNATRTAEQARSRLEDAKQRILAGEDFAALAAEISEDPGTKNKGGDLGFFGRGAMVEGFENAAFATAAGDMVGPVETDFGYHLIQVLERNDGGLRPFEEVEPGIKQRLLAERARLAAEQKATKLSQRAASAEGGLAGLAETENGVSFQTTPAFAADDNVPSIGRATPLADAAFDLEVGAVSAPVRLARGWAILTVTEIQEPRLPGLEEVRPQVEAALRAETQRQAALDRLAAARDQGIDALARAAGVEVEETDSFARTDAVGSLGNDPAVLAAVFDTDVGGVGGPVATDAGAVMFEVTERQRMDPLEFDNQKAEIRASLESRQAAQLVSALVANRREQLKVSLDAQLLANFEIDNTGSTPG